MQNLKQRTALRETSNLFLFRLLLKKLAFHNKRNRCPLIVREIDESFSLEKFLISGFAKPLGLDRNSRDGGIMLFIRDNIPFRLSKPGNLPSNTEALLTEINLRKKKWIICCG